jgi:antitoxin VapB
MTGETKTEAIRKALEERKRRLVATPVADRRAAVLRFLKKQVWAGVPTKEKGRILSRAEEDAILGYGPEGV